MQRLVPECIALPQAAETLALSGFDVFDKPYKDAVELADRIQGATSIYKFFLDRPLPSKVIIENGIKEIICIGPATQVCDAPDQLRDAGIDVWFVPGGAVDSVAEYTLTLILMLLRKIPQGMSALNEGKWPKLVGLAPSETTIGIIGYGAIGQRVARLAANLGMQVCVYASAARSLKIKADGYLPVNLKTLLRSSDVITLHRRAIPLEGPLLTRNNLQDLKCGACLVNTARAELITNSFLLEGLESGCLSGVALDVFDQEPLPKNDPLRGRDNVVLLPHLAWMTRSAIGKMVALAMMDKNKMFRVERVQT